MSSAENAKDDAGRGTVWAFLILGILLVLAGIFIPQEWSTSLRQTEILTGAFFVIGAVAALLLA
jgi:predicted transporter